MCGLFAYVLDSFGFVVVFVFLLFFFIIFVLKMSTVFLNCIHLMCLTNIGIHLFLVLYQMLKT